MNCSIVITHWNKGKRLLDAILSVVGQVEKKDEIIVVDDCSQDLISKQTLRKARARYPKISFFINERNRGSSFAKDLGISKSKNDIIILLDGDDVLPEDSVAKIKAKFLSDDSLSFVFGNYTVKNTVTKTITEVDCSYLATSSGLLDARELARNWKLLGSSPFKKEAYLEVGGYDYLYPNTDDVDFHKRAILQGYKYGYLNEMIYVWNILEKSKSLNQSISPRNALFSTIRSLEFYFKYLPSKNFLWLLIEIFLRLLAKKNKFLLFLRKNLKSLVIFARSLQGNLLGKWKKIRGKKVKEKS